MSAPSFSVVVAAYEAAPRIAGLVDAVLAQTYSDLELLVVDDGSTDDTAERVETAAGGDRRVSVIRQINAGTVAARNAGIEASGGTHICFCDDDDLWLPSHLARTAEAIGGDPRVGLCHGDAWIVDLESSRASTASSLDRFTRAIRQLPPNLGPGEAERALLRVNFVTTCSATVSRRALEEVGPLDPSIRGADDWDLWLRIVAAGYRMVRAQGRTAVFRKRAESVSTDQLMMARNASIVLDRALERGGGDGRRRRAITLHKVLVEGEIKAAGSGARSRAVARVLRRLGRKRIRRSDGTRSWRQPSGELAALLARSAGVGNA